MSHAVATFALISAGEILWGLLVGWTLLRLRRWVRDPRIEIMLSLLTPFLAYWPPEHLGGSGVLATVVTGLYISWNGLKLISAATRLQGIFFWDFLIYLTEGMVFLITGLQARTLLAHFSGHSLTQLAWYAAAICVVVIAARFVWMYPATYVPRWLSSRLRRKDPAPPWQWPFAIAFTGIRGIVSLAAALAIPLTMDDGRPFPHRDLILFLTFSVILVTLVGQGLLLPAVIRALGLANAGRREHETERRDEFAARREAIVAASARLASLRADGALPDEVFEPLRREQTTRLTYIDYVSGGSARHREIVARYDEAEIEMVAAERELINESYRLDRLEDEPRRRIERDLDLRDATLANLRSDV